jgi:hypothetical protein
LFLPDDGVIDAIMHRKQKNEMNRKYYLNVKKLVYQSFKFKNAYQTVAYVLNR